MAQVGIVMGSDSDMPVMAKAADILEELGLTVPNTWDEFFEVVSILQRNNMEVGFPQGMPGMQIFRRKKMHGQRQES